jgi:triosephosphate isomerase
MAKVYMIGNWKMNQSLEEINDFFYSIEEASLKGGNYWIAPQTLHISTCLKHSGKIKIGAQNCSNYDSGAFTGETSAVNLKEIGAHFCLVGHSERRSLFNETDKLVNEKTHKLLEVGLVPVICIGETLEERESGKTLEVVLRQLSSALKNVNIKSPDEIIIAYEPVWAIGTGKTATPEQAEDVHGAIRERLGQIYHDLGANISILYGGSVKPANVAELLEKPNINGGLVGGASLDAESFTDLCNA